MWRPLCLGDWLQLSWTEDGSIPSACRFRKESGSPCLSRISNSRPRPPGGSSRPCYPAGRGVQSVPCRLDDGLSLFRKPTESAGSGAGPASSALPLSHDSRCGTGFYTAYELGAYAVAISGAGPSVLAILDRDNTTFPSLAEDALARAGLTGWMVRIFDCANKGAEVAFD